MAFWLFSISISHLEFGPRFCTYESKNRAPFLKPTACIIILYIYKAYSLIRWATFLGFKKSRSRGKDEQLRQEKAKMRKKTQTLKREKPPHQVWGVFLGHFYSKTGENCNFDLFLAHSLRLWPYIYIHIHATGFICGPPKRVSSIHLRPPNRSFAAPPFRNHCFCSAKRVFCGFRKSSFLTVFGFFGFFKNAILEVVEVVFCGPEKFLFFGHVSGLGSSRRSPRGSRTRNTSKQGVSEQFCVVVPRSLALDPLCRLDAAQIF